MAYRSIKEIRTDVESLQKELGIKVRFKDEWWLMKLMGALLFFNKRFMTTFTTTFGSTVAFPNRKFIEDDARFVRVMIHEMIHIEDHRKLGGLLFSTVYTAPQIFAVGALASFGAFWDLQFLWCLAFLIFLAPWPSPGRVWAELRGYAITMAYHKWYSGVDLQADPAWIEKSLSRLVANFVGWNYYRMWWSKKDILKRLGRYIDLINDGEGLGKEIPLAPRIRQLFEKAEEAR